MKYPFLLLLLLGMAVGCGGAGESSEPLPITPSGNTDDPHFQALLQTITADMQKHRAPGAAVAVVEHGMLVASAGIGEKREGTDDPVLPSSLFRVASLTKMLTSATALKLHEEGRLDLSLPVTTYVPLGLAPALRSEHRHPGAAPQPHVGDSRFR